LLVRAHNSPAAGAVTMFSVWVLMATAFSALTFLPCRNTVPVYGYTMAMGVFVLVVNVVFVLSTLWRLLQLLQWGIVRRLLGRCCSPVTHGCWQIHPSGMCRGLWRSAQSLLGAICLRMAAAAAGAFPMLAGCRTGNSAASTRQGINGGDWSRWKQNSGQQQLPLGDPPAACNKC
jgi:hypothetical protein